MSMDIVGQRLHDRAERSLEIMQGLPILGPHNLDTRILDPSRVLPYIDVINYSHGIESSVPHYAANFRAYTDPDSFVHRNTYPWVEGELGHADVEKNILDQVGEHHDLSRLPNYHIDDHKSLLRFMAGLACTHFEQAQPFIQLHGAREGSVHEKTVKVGDYDLLEEEFDRIGEAALAHIFGTNAVGGQENYHLSAYVTYADLIAYFMSPRQLQIQGELFALLFKPVGVSDKAHQIGLGRTGIVLSHDDPEKESAISSKVNSFYRSMVARQGKLAATRNSEPDVDIEPAPGALAARMARLGMLRSARLLDRAYTKARELEESFGVKELTVVKDGLDHAISMARQKAGIPDPVA